MIYDFIALDFETATSEHHSACSLGLVFVKGSKIVNTKYYLIKPPMDFTPYNTKIHGLDARAVKDAPTFKEVWEDIQPLIKNTLLIAHAAKFDISVLVASCHFYNLPLPHFQYVDSIDLFRAAYPRHQKSSLDYCATTLDIPLENHHDALEDAVACAHIAIKSIKRIKRFPLAKMIVAFQSIDIKTSDVSFTLTNLDPDHPLYGKEVILRGGMISEKGNLKIEYKTKVDAPTNRR